MTASLSRLSMSELRNEIKKRQRRLDSLRRKRLRLAEQLQELDDLIAKEGGELTAVGGRKRPRNEQNLADALAELLASATMSVTEAAREVQAAGYRTTSPNFRTIVNQTLLKDTRFKRVGRGLYTAGSKAAARAATRGTRAGKRTTTRHSSKKKRSSSR